MAKQKKILVSPLDWGLGHATRMVPIINALLQKGAHVIIGADNRPYEYLKQRFPSSELIRLPGFVPQYQEKGSMAWAMMKAFPKMKVEAKKANALLQTLIDNNKIDVIISDNRYELYSKKAYSIFITHQLNIQAPGITRVFKPFIQSQVNSYIQKFDELWIPDIKGTLSLSGKLSHVHKCPIDKVHFIGPLSRFSLTKTEDKIMDIDLLIVLSGPEPQRSILEKKLVEQASETDLKTIVLQGKPETKEEQVKDNVRIIPHVDDEQFALMVKSARYIISRPGYSTIMDLATLGKKAIFIPTPGQTEQEYLANKVRKEGLFYSANQDTFELYRAIEEFDKYSGIKIDSDNQVLNNRIEELLS